MCVWLLEQGLTPNPERNKQMRMLGQPTKRKFSQSCNSKQDFFDLLVMLRDAAEKKQYDPENTFSKEYQQGFGDGKWSLLNSLIDELAKSPDTRSY